MKEANRKSFLSPLLSSALLLAFVCAMMKTNDEHAKKFTPRLKGGRGMMLTKLISFIKHYNGLILYFITESYLLLACFYVVFLYILVKKLIFSILTHNLKNSVENVNWYVLNMLLRSRFFGLLCTLTPRVYI